MITKPQGSGKGWWKHSKEHSDARKGIKTIKQNPINVIPRKRTKMSMRDVHRSLFNGSSITHAVQIAKLDENLGRNITILRVNRLRKPIKNEQDGLYEIMWRRK